MKQLEGERAGLGLVLPGPSPAAASLLTAFCRNNLLLATTVQVRCCRVRSLFIYFPFAPMHRTEGCVQAGSGDRPEAGARCQARVCIKADLF